MEDPRLECCIILQDFWDNNNPMNHIYDKDGYKWFSMEQEIKEIILELLKPLYTKTLDNYYWDPYSGLIEAGIRHGHLLADRDIEELKKILQAWYKGDNIKHIQVSGRKWRIKYDKYIHGWSIVEDLGKHQILGELKYLKFLESMFPGQYQDRISELSGEVNPKIYYHITKTGINPVYQGRSEDRDEVKRLKRLKRRREWRKKKRGRV